MRGVKPGQIFQIQLSSSHLYEVLRKRELTLCAAEWALMGLSMAVGLKLSSVIFCIVTLYAAPAMSKTWRDIFKPLPEEQQVPESEQNPEEMREYFRKNPKEKDKYIRFCVDLFTKHLPDKCRHEMPTLEHGYCSSFTKNLKEAKAVCTAVANGKEVKWEAGKDGSYGPKVGH